MITVTDLHKRFGDNIATRGVTFQAPDGEVTGLLGPNGAGKTSTLRMLYGLLVADSGKISVDDVDVCQTPLAAQHHIGVLPDSHGLYQRLTAREHIQYFGQLHGLGGRQLHQRTQELIELLDMQEIVDRRTAGFSQGERMKVAIARALVHQPKNILLDEPTNGLDVMSTRAVRALINKLRDRGHCVLFSSHIMQEVSALCDKIVIISKGRVIASGTPDDIRQRAGTEQLEDAFVALAADMQELS